MSDKPRGQVTLQWAGGEHEFRLTWAALRSVETATDMGPLALLGALQGGTWRLDHAATVLRHGLIGAGMEPLEAKSLLLKTADICTPVEMVKPATLALAAALFGLSDDVKDADNG
jgi:hypothetical protein